MGTSFIIAESMNNTIEYMLAEKILGVGYYTVVALMAIIGNIFIIYATSLIRGRTMDLMTISLIRTLAVNDLIGGIILYPHFIILLSLGRFPFHWIHCILLGICEIYFPLVSTLLVLTLVITKVSMIRDPFLCMKGPERIYVTVVVLYLIGVITPLGAFVDLGDYMFSPERGTCTYNFYPKPLIKKLYVITCTTVFVIIPLMVIIVLSGYILRFVKKHRTSHSAHGAAQDARNAADPSKKSRHKTLTQKERVIKSVMVVLLVVVAYVVCWSMFFCVTSIAFVLGGENQIPGAVLLWQKALLMTNNAVNPIVYIYSNTKLQLIFYKTLKWITCKGEAKPSRPIVTSTATFYEKTVFHVDVDKKVPNALLLSPILLKSMKLLKRTGKPNKDDITVSNVSSNVSTVIELPIPSEYGATT